MITKESIEAAHERIKPFIHKTPVLTSQSPRLKESPTTSQCHQILTFEILC